MTPILLILLVLFIIEHSLEKRRSKIEYIQRSMRPAVAGLVFSAFFTLARPILPKPTLWCIVVLCTLLLKFEFFRKYPQLIIIFGALVGIVCKNWLI
jgi:chromate transport protein ChrA